MSERPLTQKEMIVFDALSKLYETPCTSGMAIREIAKQVVQQICTDLIAEAVAAERERVLPLARKAFDAGIDAGAEATARHYHGQKRLGQDDFDKQFEHIAKAIRDGGGS